MVKVPIGSTYLELSDPRKCDTHGWVVEVKRASDEKKMGEVVLSKELLPDRKNKQGKVIWCLPSDENITPRLGLCEQRLVLAEYRKQRKEKKDANREKAKAAQKTQHSTHTIAHQFDISAVRIQSVWRRIFAQMKSKQIMQADSKEADSFFSSSPLAIDVDPARISLSVESIKTDISPPYKTPIGHSSLFSSPPPDQYTDLLAALISISDRCGTPDDKLQWTSNFKFALVEGLEELAELAWRRTANLQSSSATVNHIMPTTKPLPPPGWPLDNFQQRPDDISGPTNIPPGLNFSAAPQATPPGFGLGLNVHQTIPPPGLSSAAPSSVPFGGIVSQQQLPPGLQSSNREAHLDSSSFFGLGGFLIPPQSPGVGLGAQEY